MSAAVHSAVTRLTNLLKLVVGRGKIQTVDDTGVVQKVQLILNGLETPTIRRVAEFGFTSWPMPNADAICIFIGGDRSNGVVIATNDQKYRFKLQNQGEAAISDAFGKSIWFQKTGGIVVEANGEDVTINNAGNVVMHATTKITLDAPNAEFTGNLKVDGDITVGGNGVVDGNLTVDGTFSNP